MAETFGNGRVCISALQLCLTNGREETGDKKGAGGQQGAAHRKNLKMYSCMSSTETAMLSASAPSRCTCRGRAAPRPGHAAARRRSPRKEQACMGLGRPQRTRCMRRGTLRAARARAGAARHSRASAGKPPLLGSRTALHARTHAGHAPAPRACTRKGVAAPARRSPPRPSGAARRAHQTGGLSRQRFDCGGGRACAAA